MEGKKREGEEEEEGRSRLLRLEEGATKGLGMEGRRRRRKNKEEERRGVKWWKSSAFIEVGNSDER